MLAGPSEGKRVEMMSISLYVVISAPVASPIVAAVWIATMVPGLHVYVLGDAVELASRKAHVDVRGAGGVPATRKTAQPASCALGAG